MRLSVICPTYDMKDGLEFLGQSFAMLKKQTFKDFEAVVTDDSIGEDVREFCEKEKDLPLRYIKNLNPPGMGSNTNCGILFANGELIKILYQDDRLAHENALKVINENFTDDVQWLATGCVNTQGVRHNPLWNDNIIRGINTIGSPSVITIRKTQNPILFDTKLNYTLDCLYYFLMQAEYGAPKLINDVNVVIGIGEHQTTNLLSEERKKAEIKYLINRYA